MTSTRVQTGRWTERLRGPVIVGLALAGAGIVAFGGGRMRLAGHERAEELATLQSLRTIEAALKAYRVDQGCYPPTLESLAGAKLLDGNFDDAWSTPIRYQQPGARGEDFWLISAGRDRRLGTEDDLDLRPATGQR